jgi:hypothetical protein
VHSLDFYTYNSADVFAMRIDSSGNVGIGTSSPTSNRQLTLYGNDAGLQMTGSGAGSNVYLTSTPGSGANFFFGTTSAKPIIFVTNGATTERMRIDSSGNVLVGTTSTGPGLGNTNTGIQFQQSGVGVLSMSNEPTLYVNRNGTDGTIAQFRKNGSTVGSIGTAFDDIYVGNSDVGLLLNASGDNIWPFNTGTQSVRDNAIDLGYNGGRFKDLYLSGGVYLGGTGSANHLDDYEEGTWNPTIIGSSTNPTVTYGSSTSGRYTKIGRVVMLKCDIAVAAISGGSGSARINGVPFNSSGFPAWDSAVFRDADAIKISGQTSRVTGWVGNGVFYITYVGSFTANCGDADLPISSIGTGRIQFTTWFTV